MTVVKSDKIRQMEEYSEQVIESFSVLTDEELEMLHMLTGVELRLRDGGEGDSDEME